MRKWLTVELRRITKNLHSKNYDQSNEQQKVVKGRIPIEGLTLARVARQVESGRRGSEQHRQEKGFKTAASSRGTQSAPLSPLCPTLFRVLNYNGSH